METLVLDPPGSKQVPENWPAIDFTDDRDGCLFTATVHRPEMEGAIGSTISSEESSGKGSEKGSEKSSEKILALLKASPNLAARELAGALGITQRAVEKQIARLRAEGRPSGWRARDTGAEGA